MTRLVSTAKPTALTRVTRVGPQPFFQPDEVFFQQLARRVSSGAFAFEDLEKYPNGAPTPAGQQTLLQRRLLLRALLLLLRSVAKPHLVAGPRPTAATLLAALRQPPLSWSWALEGSLEKGLTSLDPRRLLSHLANHYLDQQVFGDLLHKALRRRLLRPGPRHLERGWSPEEQLTALLQELYLAQLDTFVAAGVTLRSYREGATAATPPGSQDRRLRLHRCGDQLLLLLQGSRADAEEVRRLMLNFCRGDLALVAAGRDRLELRHLATQEVSFMVYGLKLQRSPRQPSGELRLRLRRRELLLALREEKFLRAKPSMGQEFFPQSYPPALKYPPGQLVTLLARIFWGLSLYGQLVGDVSSARVLLQSFGRDVAAMTLAHRLSGGRRRFGKGRRRVSYRKVLQVLGPRLTVANGRRRTGAWWPELPLRGWALPTLAQRLPAFGDPRVLLRWLVGQAHSRWEEPLTAAELGGAAVPPLFGAEGAVTDRRFDGYGANGRGGSYSVGRPPRRGLGSSRSGGLVAAPPTTTTETLGTFRAYSEGLYSTSPPSEDFSSSESELEIELEPGGNPVAPTPRLQRPAVAPRVPLRRAAAVPLRTLATGGS
jgi:hypothetical protein